MFLEGNLSFKEKERFPSNSLPKKTKMADHFWFFAGCHRRFIRPRRA